MRIIKTLLLVSSFFLASSAFADITGMTTPPAGANGNVQFNKRGSFGADSTFTYSTTTKNLSVSTVTASKLNISTISVSTLQVTGLAPGVMMIVGTSSQVVSSKVSLSTQVSGNLALTSLSSTGTWTIAGATLAWVAGVSSGTRVDTTTTTYQQANWSGTMTDFSTRTAVGQVTNGTRVDNSTTTHTGGNTFSLNALKVSTQATVGTLNPKGRLIVVDASNGSTTPGTNPIMWLSGGTGSANTLSELGFTYGFTGVFTEAWAPVTIGYQATSGAGFTKGDFVVATRDVTTDTAPTEKFRTAANGDVTVAEGEVTIKKAVSSAFRGNLTLYDSTAMGAGVGGQVAFGGKYTGSTYSEFASIQGTKKTAVDGNLNGQLILRVRSAAGGMQNHIVLDGETGSITQPLQPSFLVTNSAGATDVTGDGTQYTVLWGNEIFDQGSNFASNTFTAPVGGRYFLSVSITLLNVLTTHTELALTLNTSNRNYNFEKDESLAKSAPTLTATVIADMDAADTATVTIIGVNGTKTIDIIANGAYNYFSCSLIN